MPPKKAAAAASAPKKTANTKASAKAAGSKRKSDEDIDAPRPKRVQSARLQAAAKATASKGATGAKQTARPKLVPKSRAKAANGEKKTLTRAKKSTATPKAAPAKQTRATKRKATEGGEVEEKTEKVKVLPVINQVPTEKLDVYVFGQGDAGELGLGAAKHVTRPRLNALLSAKTVGVVQVAAGGMHAAAVTHDNKVLTWGVNDQGALGRDTTWEGGALRNADADDASNSDEDEDTMNPREATPTALPEGAFPGGTVIVQVAAGDSTTFALTAEGLVYGWGTFRGNEGILGFTEDITVQTTPMLIPGLKKIKHITCGGNHVLALDSIGGVWAWGSGQQNQLGRRVVERTKKAGLTPREFGLPKEQIKYVAAGADHSFAVDTKDNVWAWGLNNFGQCGISDNAGDENAIVQKPTIVAALAGHNIICMDGGRHHSVAVTDKGECLAWGRADGAQSGIDMASLPDDAVIRDERDRVRILRTPTRIPDLDCAHVAAGSDHCIAVTAAGKAYSWGFSGTYQTGQGTDDDVAVATLINNTAVKEKELVWAGAGGQYSVLAGVAVEEAVEEKGEGEEKEAVDGEGGA